MSRRSKPAESVEDDIERYSLKAKHLKCFADIAQGFDRIKPVNLIIGRNNSGKSTLLDLLEFATSNGDFASKARQGQTIEAFVKWKVNARDFEKLPNVPRMVQIPDTNWRSEVIPQQWARDCLAGALISCSMDNATLKFLSIEPPSNRGMQGNQHSAKEFDKVVGQEIASRSTNIFSGLVCFRLLADRDIKREGSSQDVHVLPDGTGMTAMIEHYLNATGADNSLVEVTLLSMLNEVFMPDAQFRRIFPRRRRDGDAYEWELYLDEVGKGLIPISEAGSGLRTVLLVLANLIILPKLKNVGLSRCIFAFEELENNLHPAIQRRLLRLLRSFASANKSHFFITTHSNVVIDLFSGSEDAQILHIVHDGDESTVSTVTTSQHAWHVLDDLDVRGSDLLQTDVVVWVEGPSDRIYFNKWMEIWTDGKLVEGMHYQCVTYGGKLSHHISYDDPEQLVADMIAALKINRNAIFIGDSDKKKDGDTLKENTQRIVDEVTEDGKGLAWITAGKEVENYIPAAVFKVILKDDNAQGPGQFTDVPNDYVAKKSKKRTKVELAREVVPHLTKSEMPLDWSERMDEVAKFICKCNRLNPTTYDALP